MSKRIAADLGGDSCHDVAHLMRLPQTLNFPKEKKRFPKNCQALDWVELPILITTFFLCSASCSLSNAARSSAC